MIEKKVNILPSAMLAIGEELFCTDVYGNGLYKKSDSDMYATCVAQFNDELCVGTELYTDIVAGEGLIFCIPHNAGSIGVYNLLDGKSECISLPDSIKGVNGKFKTAVFYNKELYLLGYTLKNIWCYSLEKKEFKEIHVPNSEGKFVSATVVGESIYAVSKSSTCIWKVDCSNKVITVEDITFLRNGYADIKEYRGKLILMSFNSKAVHVVDDLKKKDKEKEYIINGTFESWPHGGSVMDEKGNCYLTSNIVDGVYSINVDKNECKLIEFDKEIRSKITSQTFGKPQMIGRKLILWIYKFSEIVEYDCELGVARIAGIYSRNIPPLHKDALTKKVDLYENQIYGLKEFVRVL